MVTIEYFDSFAKSVKKLKHHEVSKQIKNQILKIIENPLLGKPMRYSRQGSREVYIGSHRISYKYYEKEERIFFIEVYHKDEQ